MVDEIELREIEAYLVDGERWMTVEAMDYGESSIVALIAEVRRLRRELERYSSFVDKVAVALSGSGTDEEVLSRLDALFTGQEGQDAT